MKQLKLTLPVMGMGLLCGALRRTIWAVTYDAESQLLTEPELLPLSHGFLAVCLLIALALLMKGWPGVHQAPPPYHSPLPVLLLRLISAVLTSVSGLLLFFDLAGSGLFSPIPLLLALAQAAAGGAMLLLSLERAADPRRLQTLLILPLFAACYWSVAFYHAFGSSPSMEVYLYPILAGLCAMACWIFYAGFTFRPGESKLFAGFSLALLLLVPPALCAPLTAPYRLSLAAQLLWFFASVSLLDPQPPLRTEEDPQAAGPLPARAEE